MNLFKTSAVRRLVPLRHRALRSPHAGVARWASTESASDAARSKSQDAMGGVLKGAPRAWETAKSYLAPLGQKAGNIFGSYRGPLMYNLAVGRALLKQIYVTEGLSPPLAFDAWKSAYCTIWSRAASRTWWRETMGNGEWARLGVYVVEAYAIFKVGEIIGRRSLVGYNVH